MIWPGKPSIGIKKVLKGQSIEINVTDSTHSVLKKYEIREENSKLPWKYRIFV